MHLTPPLLLPVLLCLHDLGNVHSDPVGASSRGLRDDGWEFTPLKVGLGQEPVTCGGGQFLHWHVSRGSQLIKGDPFAETCPHLGQLSVTCVVPTTGVVASLQPLNEGDDILAQVPDGILAVVQKNNMSTAGSIGGCKPVKCMHGSTFGSFLWEEGDTVRPGNAIALTLSADGRTVHCRTDVGGRIVSLVEDLKQATNQGALVEDLAPDLVVACVGPPYTYPDRSTLHEVVDGDEGGASGPPSDWVPVGRDDSSSRMPLDATSSVAVMTAKVGPGMTATGPRAHFLGPSNSAGQATYRRLGVSVQHKMCKVAVIGSGEGISTTASTGADALGAGSGAEATEATTTAAAETTMPTSTTGTGEKHQLIELTFDADYKETLPTKDHEEEFKSKLHDKIRNTWPGMNIVDLREGSIIASMRFPDGLTHEQMADLREGSCIIMNGVQMCPKDANPVFEEGTFGQNVAPPDGGAQSLWSRISPGTRGFHMLWVGLLLLMIGAFICWRVSRKSRDINGYKTVPTHDDVKDHRPSFHRQKGNDRLDQLESQSGGHGELLTFLDPHNSQIELPFYYKPHGMHLERHQNFLRVVGFTASSQAEERGVNIGWRLTGVGRHKVGPGETIQQVQKRLDQLLEHMPPYPLRIEFIDSRHPHTPQSRQFDCRDLGMEISHTPPFKVVRFEPDGIAREKGVEIGQVLHKVGHRSLEHFTHAKLMELIREGTEHLPPDRRGYRVDFCDYGGRIHHIYFNRKPLGIHWSGRPPLKVEDFDFNSYAKAKGVQKGWTIRSIADHSVQHEPEDKVVRALMEKAEEMHLEPWPLRIDFDVGRHREESILFARQPLGFDITESPPFKVHSFSPDSYAESLGVQRNWEIRRIADVVINQSSTHSEVQRYLDEGKAPLPHATSGLKIEFEDEGGHPRTIFFERRPLGMSLSRGHPVVVESFDFNSYAHDNGVKERWKIRAVESKEVTYRVHGEEVERWIDELAHEKRLRVWPLRIDFDEGHGKMNTKYFERYPLGMALTKSYPFQVQHFKPDSYAQEEGVKEHWEVKRIGNTKVTSETRYDWLAKSLDSGTEHLETEEIGLRMEFKIPHRRNKVMYLRRQPVGITPSDHAPFKVGPFDFNSYARELGVQEGWEIERVSNTPVTSRTSCTDVMHWLRDGSIGLDPWPLRVDFQTGHHGFGHVGGRHNDVKTVWFERRDLGIIFTKQAPVSIQRFQPDSYAQSLGCKANWQIARIGDEPVDGHTPYSRVMELLEMGLQHLPHEGKGIPVVFMDDRHQRHLKHFEYHPLGVSWSTRPPVKVEQFSFNSYAKHIGVHLGWTVTKIGTEEVHSHHARDNVEQLLEDRLQYLPPWPLKLDFDPVSKGSCGCKPRSTPRALPKSFSFDRQPLGIVFENKTPVRVSKLDLHGSAKEKGVEEGWVLMRVGDEDVTRASSGEVQDFIQRGLEQLPHANSGPPPKMKREKNLFTC